MRMEGLCKLKKIYLIGTRTHNLPACRIVSQPTMIPCAYVFREYAVQILIGMYGIISKVPYKYSGMPL
jgi:hypothetical protein